jgi:uncharacterized protein YjiS (DUF1127 family)
MTLLALSRSAAAPRSGGLFSLLWRAASLRRQRAQVASMSDRMLADIGLTRAEALREAARPVWDVPGHWRG